MQELVLKELLKEKAEKSKMKGLNYNELEMQEYLESNNINVKQKQLLFKIRTRIRLVV